MHWRAHSTVAALALLVACSSRSPVPSAEARARAAHPTGPNPAAQVAGRPVLDAGVPPCLALMERYDGALAEASRSCRSRRDCVCVARPPFDNLQVVVGRTAVPELEAIAAAMRAEKCPPIWVDQMATKCVPVCRRGQCVAK
jgi:hypothetical protein